jgi:hypothetical protein
LGRRHVRVLNVLVVNPEERRSLGRSRHRQIGNMKIDVESNGLRCAE